MKESSLFSLSRFNFAVHQNPVLFTNLLLETNLLILTYPLQTMKTRMQSRHKSQDLCHFMKNNVEKARKLTFDLSNALRNSQRLWPDHHGQFIPLLYFSVLGVQPTKTNRFRISLEEKDPILCR